MGGLCRVRCKIPHRTWVPLVKRSSFWESCSFFLLRSKNAAGPAGCAVFLHPVLHRIPQSGKGGKDFCPVLPSSSGGDGGGSPRCPGGTMLGYQRIFGSRPTLWGVFVLLHRWLILFGFVAADLSVALAHGSAFLITAGFQHRIFAKAGLDVRHGLFCNLRSFSCLRRSVNKST